MNVNDQWMLERMQQMAANMAASLPQTSQNTDAAKPEKGESFQDMMNKAKDQKVDAPKKDTASQKPAVQKKEQPQKAENTPQPVQNAKTSGTYNFDNTVAALVAAGFAQIDQVYEDGTVDITMNGLDVGGVFAGNPALLGDGQLAQVQITTGDGQQITVSPEELQKVFDAYGLEGPQKGDTAATLVGQIDPSKFQDAKVITPDGTVSTWREAVAQTSDDGEDDLNAEVTVNSQPLFHDVKAAPVKVGENFQLDTQEPDMDANLADAIRFAAQQGLRQIEIKLSPENLGNLTIKLTQSADGTLQVVLHAANAKAANLLTQHMDGLNAALQGYSQNNEVHVEVQRGDNSQQAQQQQQQTDPDGHNQQRQQQQERQQESEHRGDFVQRLRLGLFGLEDL